MVSEQYNPVNRDLSGGALTKESGLSTAKRRFDMEQLRGSNLSRSNKNKRFHTKETPVLETDSEISQGLKKQVEKAQDILLTQPRKGIQSIFSNGFSSIKEAVKDFENNASPSAMKARKYGMLALSAGFAIYALTSTLDLVKSLWNKDQSHKGLKLASAFAKWTMALGLGGGALGVGPVKFSNLKTILTGGGLTILLSQLSGVGENKSNMLGKVAKVTGTEGTLRDALGRLSAAPPVVND